MTISLKARKRVETGKGAARKLRAAGKIPGIIYGAVEEPISLSLDTRELSNLIGHDGETGLIELLVEDEAGKKIAQEKAVIRQVDYDPERDSLVHIDFLSVAMDKKITVSVPVELLGEAVGVIQSKGILTQITHSLEVECLPGLLPSSFQVDISHLEIGDSIHVGDLPELEGVKIRTGGEHTLATVEAPRAEEVVEVEEEEVPEEEVEPELVGKEGEEEAAEEEKEKEKE
jgi:large subunit ribosomal protein L25